MGYFEKSICELSREPNITLVMLKAIEQQRFTDGREAEAEKHRWIPTTERLPTEKDGKSYPEHGDKMIDVLVYDTDKDMYVCPYNLRKNNWECEYNDHILWQPLPEA